ncbi:MAG: hypothetical protein PHI63_03905 [Patescibacteria group bacterium]|nr:hypothetical protein [Patescibacteria group bacterium]
MAYIHVLLDLDGVVCRWPHQQVADWEGKSALLLWLAAQQRKGGVEFRFLPITNRPAGHLQYVCYDWHVASGVCIAESGGAAYFPATNTQRGNPRFEEFRTVWRPRIAAAIAAGLAGDYGHGGRFQDEPAGRLVTLEVIAENRQDDLRELELRLREILAPFEVHIRWEVGKSVVIYPADCDKVAGLRWLPAIYHSRSGDMLNWERTLFVADGQRDIAAAQYVARQGGNVAAVGGSHPDYTAAVRKLGGLVVPSSYERGLLEILQQCCKLA